MREEIGVKRWEIGVRSERGRQSGMTARGGDGIIWDSRQWTDGAGEVSRRVKREGIAPMGNESETIRLTELASCAG